MSDPGIRVKQCTPVCVCTLMDHRQEPLGPLLPIVYVLPVIWNLTSKHTKTLNALRSALPPARLSARDLSSVPSWFLDLLTPTLGTTTKHKPEQYCFFFSNLIILLIIWGFHTMHPGHIHLAVFPDLLPPLWPLLKNKKKNTKCNIAS